MRGRCCSYVLVPQVLEQLQLAVGALRKNGGAEGLHDLLDGDRSAGKLVLGGAAVSVCQEEISIRTRPIRTLPYRPAASRHIGW